MLLVAGIALLGVASLGGRLGGPDAVPSPSAVRSTAPPSPSPTVTSVATPQASATASIPEPPAETAEPAPPPTRLVIPALRLDAPVVDLPIVDKTWDISVLTYEIAHLGGTANPGEKSNMVLAGHVTLRTGGGPFLKLEYLKPGDTATVYAGDEAHTYRVVDKKYVAPDDVSVTHPGSDAILTLLTCTSWDAENRAYRQRVAVIADLVEHGPPTRTQSRISPDQ